MIKAVVIIGVLVLILGGVFMLVGQRMRTVANSKIDECNTISGTAKQILDSDYHTECVNAVDSFNSGGTISFSGEPLILVGVIIMIAGLIMKGTSQQRAP